MLAMMAALKDVENGLREGVYNVPVGTLRIRSAGQVSLNCKPGPVNVL